jgi:hypothetical protein
MGHGGLPKDGGNMSRQKKFYLEPRKPNGIYYYIVRDPVSRKTITYRTTGTTDKRQADAIGMDWWTNYVCRNILKLLG